MAHLYITEQGAYLRKKGNTIRLEKSGEKILEMPIKEVHLLLLFGKVQISVQAMLALLYQGCDISMMTSDGHFRGRVQSALGKNSELRRLQHEKTKDIKYTLEFTKKVSSAKISNGMKLLKDFHYNKNNPVNIDCFDKLQEYIEKISNAESIEEIRGYEGNAAKIYFREGISECLINKMGFNTRQYFPSPDPVNALLSFGYSFISREMQGILDAFGLDPYIGFFHQIKYGRASLSLDMIEEFRHCYIDRLILKLVNKKILDEDDFYYNEKRGGCYLKKDALKVFIKHFEEYADKENVSYGEGKFSFRKILWKQAEKMKESLEKNVPYQPYVIK